MQLEKSGCTSVGEGRGGSSGIVSSGIFNSTDSQRRSSINYYSRLLRFREDKGRSGRNGRETETEQCLLYIVLDFLFVVHFPLGGKRKKEASVALCLSSVTCDGKTSTSTEQRGNGSLWAL